MSPQLLVSQRLTFLFDSVVKGIISFQMIFSKQKTGYRDPHKRFRQNFKTEIGQHLYKSIQTQLKLKLILETLIKPKEIGVMHKKIPFVNFVFYRYYYEREREIEIFRNSSLLSFTKSNSTFFHRKRFLSQQQIWQMKNKARQIFVNLVRVFFFEKKSLKHRVPSQVSAP